MSDSKLVKTDKGNEFFLRVSHNVIDFEISIHEYEYQKGDFVLQFIKFEGMPGFRTTSDTLWEGLCIVRPRATINLAVCSDRELREISSFLLTNVDQFPVGETVHLNLNPTSQSIDLWRSSNIDYSLQINDVILYLDEDHIMMLVDVLTFVLDNYEDWMKNSNVESDSTNH